MPIFQGDSHTGLSETLVLQADSRYAAIPWRARATTKAKKT